METIQKKDYLRLLIAPTAFLVASSWLWFLVTYRPVLAGEEVPEFVFPKTIGDLQTFVKTLGAYKHQHWNYLFLLFSSAYIYKQTFAIPGSALLNMLSGAIFGCWPLGFPICCVLTAIGATNCFILSKMTGRKLLLHKFRARIQWFEAKIYENQDRMLWYLISMRIFPASPNWLINICAPIVNVPIHLFFTSVLIGLIPYIFLCVQAGETLSEISSFDDVFTPKRFLLLLLMTLIMITFSHFIRKRKSRHIE